ncbi:hypothetical protein JKP88DRAFT_233520 [Tribonema minus]|uniref:Uncharacterized protein n=1 Tax=Tribonema minus TaxID=303371 RepID=A0A836CMY1_9STRA|nr:hypothetical protein JKP88DRAFT_233520 [Tribonema minus]
MLCRYAAAAIADVDAMPRGAESWQLEDRQLGLTLAVRSGGHHRGSLRAHQEMLGALLEHAAFLLAASAVGHERSTPPPDPATIAAVHRDLHGVFAVLLAPPQWDEAAAAAAAAGTGVWRFVDAAFIDGVVRNEILGPTLAKATAAAEAERAAHAARGSPGTPRRGLRQRSSPSPLPLPPPASPRAGGAPQLLFGQ